VAVILVVDDDASVRLSLCRYLSHRAHVAIGAATGEEALGLGTRRGADVAVLDLRLPDTDGVTLFASLHRELPHLIGIIVTAYGTVPSASISFQAGISDYLEKPFSLESLTTQIEGLLKTRSSSRASDVNRRFAVSAVDRLARAVVMVVNAQSVPRTLDEWGHSVGASRGAIRAWCHAVRVRPHDALAFARGLAAVYLAPTLEADPTELLGFVDHRSITRFLSRSGQLGGNGQAISVAQYCRDQRLLENARILTEVLRLMSRRIPARDNGR